MPIATVKSDFGEQLKISAMKGKTVVNLVPLFDSGLWDIASQLTVDSSKKATLNATATGQSSKLSVAIQENKTYTLSYNSSNPTVAYVNGEWLDVNNTRISWTPQNQNGQTVTAPLGAKTLKLYMTSTQAGTFTFENIMLVEGTTAPKQFVASMKGITNPTLVKEGKNLVHEFFAWSRHKNASIVDKYKLEHTPTFTTEGTVSVSDATVVNSAYDTSGNGGRKLVRLSNGWLVSALKDTTNKIYRIYVSKDNSQTWSLAYSYNALTTLGDIALVPHKTNNGVYSMITWNNNGVSVGYVDLDTNTYKFGVDLTGTETALGNVSLAINDAGTELHATWASKNATYPNSFNIRYAKGTINADGSVTWGAVEQVTTHNDSAQPNGFSNPSIVIKGSDAGIFVQTDNFFLNGTTKINNSSSISFLSKVSGTSGNAYLNSSWKYSNTYSVATYVQSSPSAIFVPQSVNGLANGRIWVAWYGTDSTDTTYSGIKISYSDDGGVTWSAMQKLTSGNASSNQQYFPSITANKNNEISIVWYGFIATGIIEVRKIKNISGTWGSISNVTSIGNNVGKNVSTVFDSSFNFSFSEPLFIYYSGTKVGFYGTWTTSVPSSTGLEESTYTRNIVPSTTYTYSSGTSDSSIYLTEVTKSGQETPLNSGNPVSSGFTFTTSAKADKLMIKMSVTTSGKKVLYYPQIELGSTATTFAERTEESLTLAGTFHEGDNVYQSGSNYRVSRQKKEIVLDGSLSWGFDTDKVGFKTVYIPFSVPSPCLHYVSKYNGKILSGMYDANQLQTASTGDYSTVQPTYFEISIPDVDSGWGETYTPTADEIKAYFLGWRMYINNAGDPYNGTGTKTWGKIYCGVGTESSTKGLVSGSATTTLPTTLNDQGYKPYKLVYQLATPVDEAVTSYGNISLQSGDNTLSLTEGYIRREVTVPYKGATTTVINSTWTGEESSKLKNKVGKVLAIYEDGQLFTKYTVQTINSYGSERVIIQNVDYKPTSVYTVDYIPLEGYNVSSASLPLVSFTTTRSIGNKQSKECIEYLRQKTNEFRQFHGLSPITWTQPVIVPKVTPIRAVDWNEIEDGILEVYNTLGITPQSTTAKAQFEETILAKDSKFPISKLSDRIGNIFKALQNVA